MINIPGLVSIIIFYLLILGIGIFAAWWARRKKQDKTSEDVLLAGRNIGLFVGTFTMTATWVGGGYINGTSEYVNTLGYGLVWTQGPWGYALSLVLGGLLFAKKMREGNYVTMIDPIQDKVGQRMGGLLCFPALLGELFWSAAILSALGASLQVIMDLESNISIIVSACIAVLYTIVGGLYSVAYTDVAQLICIFIGLWISIPFAMTHDAVAPITSTQTTWLGQVAVEDTGVFIDGALMLIFGGIPWQVYFQRVLSSKSVRKAQLLSFIAGFGCLFMAIPPILIGAIATSTDWSQTTYRNGSLSSLDDVKLTLPLVLQYLTPTAVSFVGLGAVSAAVMSSADSSILSASSVLTRNVIKAVFWQNASEKAQIWLIRIGVFLMGALATVIAICVGTIYALWFLCSDLVYVILFPQLFLVLYFSSINTYGSLMGYIVGLFFRLTAGEPLLGLPPLIYYPWYYYAAVGSYQRFPVKTFAMLLNLLVTIVVSLLMKWLFEAGHLAPKFDIFRCVVQAPKNSYSLDTQIDHIGASETKIDKGGADQKSFSDAIDEQQSARQRKIVERF